MMLFLATAVICRQFDSVEERARELSVRLCWSFQGIWHSLIPAKSNLSGIMERPTANEGVYRLDDVLYSFHAKLTTFECRICRSFYAYDVGDSRVGSRLCYSRIGDRHCYVVNFILSFGQRNLLFWVHTAPEDINWPSSVDIILQINSHANRSTSFPWSIEQARKQVSTYSLFLHYLITSLFLRVINKLTLG